jgi:hypothetical protein
MNDANHETQFTPESPPPEGCCCWPLWGRLTATGERGLAVVVENDTDGFRFWVQSRGVDFSEERRIQVDPGPPLHFGINVVSSGRIRYCPWCGTRLDELAAEAPEAFAQLAVAHRQFIPLPI